MTLEEFLSRSWSIRRLRAGRFKDCIDLYTDRLRKDGYSKDSAASSLKIVGDFIGWLTEGQFDCTDIDEQLAARFLEARVRRRNTSSFRSPGIRSAGRKKRPSTWWPVISPSAAIVA